MHHCPIIIVNERVNCPILVLRQEYNPARILELLDASHCGGIVPRVGSRRSLLQQLAVAALNCIKEVA